MLAKVLLLRKQGEGQCPGQISLSDTAFLSHAAFCWAWLYSVAAISCSLTSAVSIFDTKLQRMHVASIPSTKGGPAVQAMITQDPKHAGLHNRLTHHRPEHRLEYALLCLPAASTSCAL